MLSVVILAACEYEPLGRPAPSRIERALQTAAPGASAGLPPEQRARMRRTDYVVHRPRGEVGARLEPAKALLRLTGDQPRNSSLDVQIGASRLTATNHPGITVAVINHGKTDLGLSAVDDHIALRLEAEDPHGRWRPIEHAPQGSCGMSHHVVRLPAGKGWRFVAPLPTGPVRTRLRYAIEGPAWDEASQITSPFVVRSANPTVHSEPFWGDVDPGQFIEPEPDWITDPLGL